ncbi:hypothetical protein H632_c440p0 [Helicosporidium sp. ATCC 50920]|nr:hypothetical protein H632_c440p0 [Helicosporidium sp. ATCC 50920]|eukprot:KDD75912.1 hypothetical protein H632_c440p0 [Helicosporidium sp. ATCC 50920]
MQLEETDDRISDATHPEHLPQQVKVIYYGDRSVLVTWSTGYSQEGPRTLEPLPSCSNCAAVQLGDARGEYTQTIHGETVTYDQLYWGFPEATNYTSPYIHRALIEDVGSTSTIYYRVGNPAKDTWSAEYSFSLPWLAPQAYPLTVGLVADGGQTHNSSTTYEHLRRVQPDLVVFGGDMTYSDVRAANGSYYDFIFNFTAPAYGNSPSPLFYSMDVGPMHIIFLSSYAPYDSDSDQVRWLTHDLSSVNRSKTPWVMVSIHAALYNSYLSHYQEAECARLAFEPLFLRYGVDLVVSGHVHAYERSFPVSDYKIDDCAPVYVTLGDGGNVEKLEAVFADLPGNCPRERIVGPSYQPDACPARHYDGAFCSGSQPLWSAFREPAFGFGTLRLENETHALFEWHRNEDPVPVVSDSVYFVRNDEACTARRGGILNVSS